MSALSIAKKSFQWMTAFGVDPSDVEWLEQMNGTQHLHLPEAARRVERIYTKAMDGLLSSESPAASILLALN